MTEPAVLYEFDHQIAEITLNRPDNRNSMTPDVLEGLGEGIRALLERRDPVFKGR